MFRFNTLTTFLIALAVLVAGCSSESDADRVSAIIRSAALEAATADRMYQEAMTQVESVRGGKPLYQVAEEVSKRASTIDYNVSRLGLMLDEQTAMIEDAAARAELEQGLAGIRSINQTRHGFLTELAGGLNAADVARLKSTSEKYAGELSELPGAAVKAMVHLSAAKQAVGLPVALTEFR